MDNHLKVIKKRIHQSCLDTSVEYGASGNYVVGANIAEFVKVVDAMLTRGLCKTSRNRANCEEGDDKKHSGSRCGNNLIIESYR